MEDNIFPHRKSESAREFLEDWVPVAFSNLCLLLVLVKDHLVLSQAHVLKDSIKIERPLTDVVVRLENIEIPSLHHE